jgi:hypothetical protein
MSREQAEQLLNLVDTLQQALWHAYADEVLDLAATPSRPSSTTRPPGRTTSPTTKPPSSPSPPRPAPRRLHRADACDRRPGSPLAARPGRDPGRRLAPAIRRSAFRAVAPPGGAPVQAPRNTSHCQPSCNEVVPRACNATPVTAPGVLISAPSPGDNPCQAPTQNASNITSTLGHITMLDAACRFCLKASLLAVPDGARCSGVPGAPFACDDAASEFHRIPANLDGSRWWF